MSVGRDHHLLMATSDISKTRLVRKYGVRGAKLFARFWFPFVHGLLLVPSTVLWALAPDLATGWRRVFLGCLVCGLTVFAASLLTRMRLDYLAAIERLEYGERGS
jgi:hypothetical protein